MIYRAERICVCALICTTLIVVFSPVGHARDAASYSDRELCGAGWNQVQIDVAKDRKVDAPDYSVFDILDGFEKTLNAGIWLGIAKKPSTVLNNSFTVTAGGTPPYFPDNSIKRPTWKPPPPTFINLSESDTQIGDEVLFSVEGSISEYYLMVLVDSRSDVVVVRPRPGEVDSHGKWVFEADIAGPVGCAHVYVFNTTAKIPLDSVFQDEHSVVLKRGLQKLQSLVDAFDDVIDIRLDYERYYFFVEE